MWTVMNQSHKEHFTHTCNNSEGFQEDLHKIAYKTHHVLETLHLTHFLCYGSLWGQIRLSRSLPWESDVEFCLLNEELTSYDEVYLIRMFKKQGLTLTYDSSEGMYVVTDPNVPNAEVQLVIFEEDKMLGMLRRVGWKRRLLPPDCETSTSLECFPNRLAVRPLPKKNFGQYELPVPREGIEIQKYHYQDNWWKEILPKNC